MNATTADPVNDLIRDMMENVAKYGGENTTTFLMVQAIGELQRLNGLTQQTAPAVATGPQAESTGDGCARLESEARIEGGRLLIALRISTLAHAARCSEYFWRAKEDGTPLRITNEGVLANSVRRALNREEEDGSTPISRMLDEAVEWVAEQGEDGIEEGLAQ